MSTPTVFRTLAVLAAAVTSSCSVNLDFEVGRAGADAASGTGGSAAPGVGRCARDLECLAPELPHCDPSIGRCVRCVPDVTPSHCASSETCVSHVCVPSCPDGQDSSCASDSCEDSLLCSACEPGEHPCLTGSVCLVLSDVGVGVCVQCTTSIDCPARTVCDLANYRCVQCTTGATAACAGSTPVCDFTTGLCVSR